MTKRLAVVLVFGCVITALLLLWKHSRSATVPPIGVAFTGREPGPPYRAAGFDLTNTGNVSILLWEVEVQVQSNAVWNTISKKPAEISPCVQLGKTNVDFQPIVVAHDCKRIIVEWPEEKPWRIQISLAREAKGVSGLAELGWIALKTHTKPEFHRQTWIISGMAESEELHR